MHVALLKGGLSAEREVSLSSAKAVSASLKQLGYRVTEIDVNTHIAERITECRPDKVFNALHGTYGEDGCVQGVLELLEVPYTHSGVLASALAMHKEQCKNLLTHHGIRCPDGGGFDIEYFSQANVTESYPCVVKPVSQGSSVGVHIVHKPKDMPTNEQLTPFGTRFLIEPYIEGKELSVTVTDDEPLGVMELAPKEGFYDYKNKYTQGKTNHVMPADVPSDIYQEAMQTAFKAHHLLGCRGISRSDFRFDETHKLLYLLEVNTHPGLTHLSITPEIAAHKGIGFDALIEYLLQRATCDHASMTADSYQASEKAICQENV